MNMISDIANLNGALGIRFILLDFLFCMILLLSLSVLSDIVWTRKSSLNVLPNEVWYQI